MALISSDPYLNHAFQKCYKLFNLCYKSTLLVSGALREESCSVECEQQTTAEDCEDI